MTNQLKAGIKTSEFWLTVVTSILSILVMAGVIGPEDSNRVGSIAKDTFSGIVAIVSIVSYVVSRLKLKRGESL